MILYLIRGLPGSGKSTYAKKLGCLMLENDMFCTNDGIYNPKRLSQAKKSVFNICRYALSKKVDVAVCGVLHTNKAIQVLIDLGKKYGATIKIIKMTGDYGNIHNVPIIAMRGFKKNWEPVEGEISENV